MGRRRYQQPSIFKTNGSRPEWYFRARVDTIRTTEGGRTIARPEQRYYLGFCDEMTKQEAKQARNQILGELINKPQVLIPSQVKFAEVLKVYRRDHMPNLRRTTQTSQEEMLRNRIEPTFGAMRLCDIDALAVQRWLTGLEMAYSTKVATFKLLRTIWNRAEDWGFTQQRFPRGKFSFGVERQVKGKDLPTTDQLRRLLAALEDPFRAMAELAMFAGLRISEIRGLKWEDVTSEVLTIRRRMAADGMVDVPKSKKSIRNLDIRPLAGIFNRLPRKSDWVFGAGCGYFMCRMAMTSARVSAGIETPLFGWHHLRAVFNTLARSHGADAHDRQAMLGHTTEAMNRVYIMAAADDVKRRGDLMAAVQAQITGETKGRAN